MYGALWRLIASARSSTQERGLSFALSIVRPLDGPSLHLSRSGSTALGQGAWRGLARHVVRPVSSHLMSW